MTEIRQLTPEDLEQLFRVREIAFLDSSDPNDPRVRELQLRALPYRKGLFVGGILSSAATVLPLEMFLGGKLVSMGGLASVQSAAEYRRRGQVKKRLHHWLEQLKSEGVGFCLEYPFDPRYYARYGWQSLTSGVRLKLPSAHLQTKTKVEARRLENGEATDRLRTIYLDWAEHYNGTLSRSEDSMRSFSHVLQKPWETRPRPAYEMEDAYCVIDLRHHGHELELSLSDYAYRSPKGRRNLLAFLGLFCGQADTVSLHLPLNDPLVADLQPYLQPNHSILQARIVSVRHALEALTPSVNAQFALRVHDDFCAWNNETQRLEFVSGKVHFKPWAQSPDLDIDIRILAALVMGGMSAEAALQTGLVEGAVEHVRVLATLAGNRVSFMPQADFF